MKTTNVTPLQISKPGLPVQCLALLVAAATVAFAPQRVWANDTVPLKGSAEGAVVSTTPVPEGVLLRTLAGGRATHLGRFTREEMLVLNPSTGTLTGTLVFTAANGDRLSGAVAAQFTSPTTVVGTITFTGGTGRFLNASGEADAIVSTADGVHFAVEFDGRVSSVGANKK